MQTLRIRPALRAARRYAMARRLGFQNGAKGGCYSYGGGGRHGRYGCVIGVSMNKKTLALNAVRENATIRNLVYGCHVNVPALELEDLSQLQNAHDDACRHPCLRRAFYRLLCRLERKHGLVSNRRRAHA